MRQKIFTFFLIAAAGLVSCRKNKIDIDIKQYDENQIQNYMKVFSLTDMKRDTSNGDTTGIYYQLLLPGKVVPPATDLVPLEYPDKVSFVFTVRTMDGKYVTTDTIQNHIEEYLGHVSQDGLPAGLQLAMKNILKYKGASARLLIPSHLAYGVNGYRTAGSSTLANANIAGNQCLDYYVHIIDDYKTYDEQVIQNRVSDLSSYTKVESVEKPGYYYYYKILTPGTGNSPITDNSSITVTYTGQLLNGSIFDGNYNGDNSIVQTPSSFAVSGLREALEKFAVAGTKISVIIPSTIAYGDATAGSIPTNSVLRFTYQIISVAP
ncbi:MAG TPA: FKBP-type peptidyl-prolyl cis-trans isomerase [Mucilaginibacter sp.]|nr:FKBP-type peptidyl-prolyl cis-trans isomerase [Mucilaginibacter sp.]